jgi:hypothetical protein
VAGVEDPRSPTRQWQSSSPQRLTRNLEVNASGLVTRNALLVRRSRTESCFSPRQLEAARNGEEQTQTSPENGTQTTRSRTIEIHGLNSLTSASSKRSYDHALREFIDWYCSEPRLDGMRRLVSPVTSWAIQFPYQRWISSISSRSSSRKFCVRESKPPIASLEWSHVDGSEFGSLAETCSNSA